MKLHFTMTGQARHSSPRSLTAGIDQSGGVPNIQRVHAEDTGDFRVALLQRELRQRSDTKFFRRHFERADGEVVEFCCADFFGPTAGKLCRDPRRLRRESKRCSEIFVQDGDKRAGIDQRMRRLAPN